MKNLLGRFSAFASKGIVRGITIGLLLALAFTAVVTSLVDSMSMRVIAPIFGWQDFGGFVIDFGDGELRYGAFITAVIPFALVGGALFLFVVELYNIMRAQQESGDADTPGPPEEITLLLEIRNALRAAT